MAGTGVRRPLGCLTRVAIRALPLMLLMTPVSAAAAQGFVVGVGAEAYVGGGEGIQHTSCVEGSTNLGVALQLGYDFSRRFGLEATAHPHLWPGPQCVIDGAPANGTVRVRSRANLLGHSFVAADFRFRFRASAGVLTPLVSVGGGVALRSRNDLPYGVLGTGLLVPVGPLRLGLQGELYVVRVRIDLFDVTTQDLQQVSRVFVTSVAGLRATGTVGVAIEMPIRFCSWAPEDPCS